MKKMKKLVSLMLAVVMVLAMTVVASAENHTITGPSNGHTYEVYQIFTGDLSSNILSNVKWGKNGTGTEGENVAQTVLDVLTAVNSASDTAKLEVIENYVNLNSQAFGTITDDVSTLSAPDGYYLIKDQDDSVTGNDAYTLYITKIVNDITISPKSGVPEFEKKVKDVNDSTANSTTGWQDSADYDIGDAVPFQLEGTVADNYADYTKYYFAFHDVEEEGLTFNSESVVVKVNGTEIESGYQVVTTGITDGCTFEVIFEDLKTINSVQAGSVITVEYTSTLNEDAVLGSTGNVNKAKLEFSNNPNDEQGGEKGTTPWDNVIVFTYKVVVNKTVKNPNYDAEDEDSKEFIPLPGAGFTLYKKGTQNEYQLVKEIGAEENRTTFTFSGLDDGSYKLAETTTPAGYNTISDIEFTVNADHTITWDGTNRTGVLTSLTGTDVNNTITFTPDVTAGSLSTDVENKSGATLPETGGIGTTIFYVVGIILVLGAGLLLITKKRMSAQK